MVRHAVLTILLLIVSAAGQAQSTGAKEDPASHRRMRFTLSTAEIKTISMDRVKGSILLPAQVAGQNVKALFDNGTGATLIDETFARTHGMQLKETGTSLNTGLSRMPMKMTQSSMVIGDALTISGQFMTADLGPMSRALGTPVTVVLGADVLHTLIAVVNPTRGWVAFGLPGHLNLKSNVSTAPQKTLSDAKDAAKTLMSTMMPTSIPLGPDDTVNATINGQPVSLEVDYGSKGAVSLRNDVWQRVIPPEARTGQVSSTTRGDGLQSKQQVGMAKELKFGRVVVKDVPVMSQATSDQLKFEGLLGLAVLGSGTTVLNMPKHQLWFFPAGMDVSLSIPKDSAATQESAAPSAR